MTIGADGVVVVGGGQAGYQAARSLRDEGYDGKIRLVSAEPYFPYQRPPLSKEYLTDGMAPERLAFSTEDIFQVAAIDLIRGVAVEELDLDGRKVRLAGGSELAYGHLILATGARNRELSYLARDDVVMLRDLADATDIRHRLGNAERIIIVGAGFLGLEIASAARSMGRDVDVIELHEMPLNRGVSRPAAEALVAAHRAAGVRFYLRRYVKSIERAGASARHVELDDGTRLTGDLIVVSIGVTPNTELAAAAGLAVSNGIIVDGALRTADPHISAIGDCCAFPSAQANGYIRLESVQNAIEQARFVASSLLQGPALYNVVPWFWSDQAGQRLQMAGLNTSHDDAIVVRKLDEPGLSVYCFRQGRLIGVDSINRPGDHMAARRMFASGRLPSRGMITARAFDLKAWSKQATA